MNVRRFVFGLAALVALASSIAFSGIARSADSRGIAGRSYLQTNLVSDIPGLAAHTDPNLKNPWGTSVGPGSPIWVSDNHAGVTTLYDGAGDRSTATDSAGDVGANYKGLALVNTPSGKFLYATSFRFGTVDVFDSHFNLVNSFTDPTVPAGFAPFGIHNIGGKLYVTFAKQGPGKDDDAAHPGNGFVDVFAPN